MSISDMVAHTFNFSTQNAETSESQRVPSQLGLHSEFQASQGYNHEILPVLTNQPIDKQCLPSLWHKYPHHIQSIKYSCT